jgi:hypothetical protein
MEKHHPESRWSEMITLREAYIAMLEFGWTYYRVGGETEKEVEFFLSHIGAGLDLDRALKEEWFEAVDKAKASK